MVEEARVVVIGSGGFGASTAYHLARRGARDVVLLDRHAIGSQTSPRAAGLTSKVASTELMIRLMDETVEALAGFEKATGRSIRFMRVGAMRVLLTSEGEARMRRDAALAQRLGIEVQFLSGGEAERMAPHFRAGAARAILFSPEDGYFHPPLVASAFAEAAADSGGGRATPHAGHRDPARAGTHHRRAHARAARSAAPPSWTRPAPGRPSSETRSGSGCR